MEKTVLNLIELIYHHSSDPIHLLTLQKLLEQNDQSYYIQEAVIAGTTYNSLFNYDKLRDNEYQNRENNIDAVMIKLFISEGKDESEQAVRWYLHMDTKLFENLMSKYFPNSNKHAPTGIEVTYIYKREHELRSEDINSWWTGLDFNHKRNLHEKWLNSMDIDMMHLTTYEQILKIYKLEYSIFT